MGFLHKVSVACLCAAIGISASGIHTISANTIRQPVTTLQQNSSETDQSNLLQLFEQNGFTDKDLRTKEYLQQLCAQPANTNEQSMKELVYEKVLNTTDYYQSVHGKYQRNEIYANNTYTMEYAVDKTNGITAAEKMLCSDGSADISFFCGTNGSRFVIDDISTFNPSTDGNKVNLIHQNYFDPEESLQNDFVSLIKATSRTQYDNEDIGHYFYRTAFPGILYATESIDPQEMGIGYLEEFDNWQIEAVEQVAGRDCWKLVGTLSGEYAEKLHAYSYEMYVDCETGFVLQYSNFDQNGALTDHLTTLEIQVNQPVSQDTFNEIAKQYLNAYNTFWNLPLV